MQSDKSQYRGYEIEIRREWSNWCARVRPSRPELPILAQSALRTLSRSKTSALTAAKRSIDEVLSDLEKNVA